MKVARRWQKRVSLNPATDNAISGLLDLPTTEEVQKDAFEVNTSTSMQELLPGFVHMRGVLPLRTQQLLLDISCGVTSQDRDAGRGGGWYRLLGNGQWNLNDGSKARFWDDISRFPPEVKSLGENLAHLAAHHFPAHLSGCSSAFLAQVCALNFYTPSGRMGWHVDDTNFAKAERPIVMANFGYAADFGYKMHKGDRDQSVRLESGDVIVFGGPARNMVHALLQVHPQTSPAQLQFPQTPGVGRMSMTWRDVGPEDGLTFNSDERLGLKVSEQTLPRYLPKGSGKGKQR